METKSKSVRSMELITNKSYNEFRKSHSEIRVENVQVHLPKKWTLEKFTPPEDYQPETTTVWSFPDRGDWATHTGKYRGNWSPYIPRNLILRYTEKGDTVLDQMVGSGTTLVECKLLERNAIGVDVNQNAIMISKNRLDFKYEPSNEAYQKPNIKTYVGDARNLDKIKSESVDLITTHPPYANIIPYSHELVEGDLSKVHAISEFADEMKDVAKESFRVLKSGKFCAILIGDTRKHAHYIPLSVRVLQSFLDAGFVLKEDIIKLQWKTSSSRGKWAGKKYNFYLIGHEHLYVFRKPNDGERLTKFKASVKWW